VIILRAGWKAVRVNPMASYEEEIHKRSFYDHRTICFGYYATRTIKDSITDLGVDSKGFTARKEHTRAISH